MSEMFDYALFGLKVRSNIPIPELTVAGTGFSTLPSVVPEDFTIRWQERPTADLGRDGGEMTYESAYMDEAGVPALKIWAPSGGMLRLEYSDGTKFWVARSGREAWATWPEPVLAIEDTATY